MLCLRGLPRLKAAWNLPWSLAIRGRTSAAGHTDEAVKHRGTLTELMKVESPSKELKKGCVLCSISVDFKNIQLLSQFISPHTGRIYGRHITGLCGRKQKEITKAIKKAHSLGFMSVTHKHPQFMKDPRICGIKHLD